MAVVDQPCSLTKSRAASSILAASFFKKKGSKRPGTPTGRGRGRSARAGRVPRERGSAWREVRRRCAGGGEARCGQRSRGRGREGAGAGGGAADALRADVPVVGRLLVISARRSGTDVMLIPSCRRHVLRMGVRTPRACPRAFLWACLTRTGYPPWCKTASPCLVPKWPGA